MNENVDSVIHVQPCFLKVVFRIYTVWLKRFRSHVFVEHLISLFSPGKGFPLDLKAQAML